MGLLPFSARPTDWVRPTSMTPPTSDAGMARPALPSRSALPSTSKCAFLFERHSRPCSSLQFPARGPDWTVTHPSVGPGSRGLLLRWRDFDL